MIIQRRDLRRLASAAFGLMLAGAACRGSGSPSSPSTPAPSTPSSLAGTWSGTASDSSGPGQMTWQVTQSGDSFTGTLTMTDAATNLGGRGSVSGTVSGARIQFSMTVPAGGFDPPHSPCTSQVSGDGEVSGSSMTGAYSGSSSCAGAIASGQFTLNKQ